MSASQIIIEKHSTTGCGGAHVIAQKWSQNSRQYTEQISSNVSGEMNVCTRSNFQATKIFCVPVSAELALHPCDFIAEPSIQIK